MIFRQTPIPGAFDIRPERLEDERGFFARTWCRREFGNHGIEVNMVQASVAHNRLAGTLRGLHFSRLPACEGKLVRCERGRAYDVILDLRPHSPAFLRHFCLELDAELRNEVYVPPGVAHGYQTLVDDTDVSYMMSDFYRPELYDGVRYDDPAFGIRWPSPVTTIHERDRDYADFDRDKHLARFAPRASA